MDNIEFWNEHVITHKLVYLRKDGKAETIGVGSINMCKRYAEENNKLNLIIEEL
jgi:hypothetical protein